MPDSDAVEEAPCCFVIAPIGDEGTDVRRRSDQILEHIIRPVVSEWGYSALRADKMPKPGLITSQVILQLIEADLVIADLTDHNPNVFYELAVRHAFRKPVIQLIQAGQGLPFDVAGLRTIFVDHRDLDSAAACERELRKHIKEIRSGGDEADSPISSAVDLAELRRSGNPLEKSNAEILESLAELRHMVASLLLQRFKTDPVTAQVRARLAEEFRMEANHAARVRPSVASAPSVPSAPPQPPSVPWAYDDEDRSDESEPHG
jgi:hypothetical protein